MKMSSCAHYWSMLTPTQQDLVRDEWKGLIKAVEEEGASGVTLELLIGKANKRLIERWIEHPLDVLWYGLSKTDWTTGAPGVLTIALMDALGWLDLARELGDLTYKGLSLPQEPARTLWEAKHELDTARARVECTAVMMRRLELTTLGHADLTIGWCRLEARLNRANNKRRREDKQG